MERTIRVTGKGRLSVKPDQIRLTMDLAAKHEVYEEALKESTRQVRQLREEFMGLGFSEDALKTISYYVDSKYENYRDGDEWKQRFTGYEFRHTVKLEFDSDNEMLGKVLSALAKSGVKPEFHIYFTVKDEEAAKLGLIARAVEDSKAKAAALAGAAGVQLKEIAGIEYSWEAGDIISSPVPRMLAANAFKQEEDGCRIDMNPDNIELSDAVTVVWRIE